MDPAGHVGCVRFFLAHSNLAMDAPHRQFNALCIEHLLPCKDVLIDAVNERAIEINRKTGSIRLLYLPF